MSIAFKSLKHRYLYQSSYEYNKDFKTNIHKTQKYQVFQL